MKRRCEIATNNQPRDDESRGFSFGIYVYFPAAYDGPDREDVAEELEGFF